MFIATPEQLADEESIVWLEDTSGMPYLRERVLIRCTSGPRRPRFTLPGQLIGYRRLRKEPEGAYGESAYTRRIFWLKPYDYPNPGPYQHGDAPYEAGCTRPGCCGEAKSGAVRAQEDAEAAGGAASARDRAVAGHGAAFGTSRGRGAKIVAA